MDGETAPEQLPLDDPQLPEAEPGDSPEVKKAAMACTSLPYKKSKVTDGKWDGAAQVKAATVDDLKVMCCGYRTDGTTKGDYYLPHHNTNGDVPKAALAAAAARLEQTDGNDVEADRMHLGKHYRDAGMEPPWEASKSAEAPAILSDRSSQAPGAPLDFSAFAVPFELLPSELKSARRAAGLPCGENICFKSLRTEIKADTGAARQYKLWIAVENEIDSVGDVLLPGFAAESISRDGPGGEQLIKSAWDHREVTGPCIDISEKTIGGTTGLLFVGQIDETQAYDKYWANLKSGAVKHGSFAYSIEEAGLDTFKGQQVRAIAKASIWEGSPVYWPANRLARMVEVRSLFSEPKSIFASPECRAAGRKALDSCGFDLTAIPAERKDLFDLANAVYALATIENAQRTLAMLSEAQWAKLTTEQQAKVQEILDAMTDSTKSIRQAACAGLAPVHDLKAIRNLEAVASLLHAN